MLISQGIWARSDNPTEVKQNKISQHREYNCLNLKKCDERTNGRTDLCIELRYAQLIIYTPSGCNTLSVHALNGFNICIGQLCIDFVIKSHQLWRKSGEILCRIFQNTPDSRHMVFSLYCLYCQTRSF